MGTASRVFWSLALGAFLVVGVVACNGDTATEPAAEQPVTDASSAEETSAVATEPLPDEELYTNLLALGLQYSYDLALEDGTYEVWQNMEGYGVVRWIDDEGREIVVSRRYVESEPEEWVYVDQQRSEESGVTELTPTGAQLQAWDTLAADILTAVGAEGELTRGYAWTSESGISTVAYSTNGVSDDSNLLINMGLDEDLGRVDLTMP